MAESKVSVATTGLVLAGLNPISSFDDDSVEAETARLIYDKIVEGLLSERYWHFAKTQKTLNRLTAEPQAEWGAAYQLPSDPAALRIKALFVDDLPIKFDRYADTLFCDASEDDTVVLEYIWRVPESDWPAFFRKYAEETLASYFASSIMRNADLMKEHRNQAAFEQTTAYTADSQDRTTPKKRPRHIIARRR